jgi:hypothetical protein
MKTCRSNPSRRIPAGLLVALLSACGGGDGSPGSGAPPVVTLLSIAVTPANPSVVVGTPQQFVATGTYSDGSTQTLTTTATWSSSLASVATVSNTAGSIGQATTAVAGTSTITATSGAITGSTLLTVTAPAITATYLYYSLTSATPQTATLRSNATLTMGTLNLTNFSFGGSATDPSGTLTSWASPWNNFNQPVVQAMLFCGTNGKLAYVLIRSSAADPNRVASTAVDLIAGIQAASQYTGMAVYTDCSGTFHTAWNNNKPLANYYLWPDVFTTYSSAFVATQLTGAVIFHENGVPADQHNFLAVTWRGGSPFEVWQ